MVTLTLSQKRALSVLAFLMFRLGRETSARRYYKALTVLCDRNSPEYRQAMAGLASVAIETNDAPAAQEALKSIMKTGAISTKESALHLLKAQALWLQDRKLEAQNACEEYMFLSGNLKDKA